jgi:predicted aspartyl protease
MLKNIIDITICSALVMGFTAGAAHSMERHHKEKFSRLMITSLGYSCDDVMGLAASDMEGVFNVSCAAEGAHHHYMIDTGTGDVALMATGAQ